MQHFLHSIPPREKSTRTLIIDHMLWVHGRTRFAQARAELVADLEERRVAVLCSETVWWRCHRRIIADTVLLLDERPVLHLMHDGKLREAEPSEGARIREDGQLVWDGADED